MPEWGCIPPGKGQPLSGVQAPCAAITGTAPRPRVPQQLHFLLTASPHQVSPGPREDVRRRELLLEHPRFRGRSKSHGHTSLQRGDRRAGKNPKDCAVCGKYVSLFCLMTVRRPSGTHTLPFPTAGRKPQHRDRGTEHTFPGQQCEFPL